MGHEAVQDGRQHVRELLGVDSSWQSEMSAPSSWISVMPSSSVQGVAAACVLFLGMALAVIKTEQTKRKRACCAAESRVFVRNLGSLYSYGLCGYGLCGYGLCSYGLCRCETLVRYCSGMPHIATCTEPSSSRQLELARRTRRVHNYAGHNCTGHNYIGHNYKARISKTNQAITNYDVIVTIYCNIILYYIMLYYNPN